jgi:NAD dependent epimerase/dehydratase
VAGLSAEENSKAWSGRRVLVTGAGGFIGSHVAETLVQAGASVRAFVRYISRGDYGWLDTSPSEILEELEIFCGDLANPEAVAGAVAGREIVLHVGALIPIPYSYRHPREFVTTNVEGTLNVLEAVRREEIERLVHISTSEVYGTARRIPIDEEHPLHPQSPYAATKVGADQLTLSYRRSFGTPVVILRPFNTYGPRQSARAVIPTIIAQALSREEIKLGATSPTRDFLYVADTVQGILRCATTEGVEGETINLGTGVEVSIGEVAQRVLRQLDLEVPISLDEDRLRPTDSEVNRLAAEVGKAKELLGWQAKVSLDEGLRRTIQWMRDFLGFYKTSMYNV